MNDIHSLHNGGGGPCGDGDGGYNRRPGVMDRRSNRRQPTLCWSCKKAYADKCGWVGFGREVDGWRADKTIIKGGKGNTGAFESYLVKACPNYRNDGKPTKKEAV